VVTADLGGRAPGRVFGAPVAAAVHQSVSISTHFASRRGACYRVGVMRDNRLHLASITILVALAACGGRVGSGPCAGDSPDPVCDQACGADTPCPPGFHCAEDGTCFAECVAWGAGCRDNEYCDGQGVCHPRIDADCPDVVLRGERTTPTVQLLLDQSGSMTQSFGNTDRWNAMKAALIDPANGVVSTTQGSVIFGASLYTGTTQVCPRLTSVARSLNNRTSIANLLTNNSPASETPTGESIDAVVADFRANPPPADSTPIILLATDGEPDTCAVPNPQTGQPQAVAAARRAFEAGIRLYILSVGSDVGAPHLQDMANAGIGVSQGAPYYVANNPAELAQALQQLVGGVLSCELQLDGVIDPSAGPFGNVILNNRPLDYGVDWVIVDGNTIRLVGDACDELLSSSTPEVSASFPCGVVVN
jgi:hypothetical protein